MARRRLFAVFLGATLAALAAAGGLCFLAYAFQGSLVYFPTREVRLSPHDVGLAYRDVALLTEDGERLRAWAISPQVPDSPWILFSHGNGGNMSHRLDRAVALHRCGVGVLLYDYRGYGQSTGTPTEEGLTLDAEAAWQWLVREQGVPPRRLILMGESLGGGVTTALATLHRPAGIILESTFTSAVDLGEEVYPWFPVRRLLRHRFPNRERLAGMDFPKLFMHSPDDDIIPYHHGRDLYQAAPEPKQWVDLVGGHNAGVAAQGPGYIETVSDFVQRVTAPPS
jgi:hypothetical protein